MHLSTPPRRLFALLALLTACGGEATVYVQDDPSEQAERRDMRRGDGDDLVGTPPDQLPDERPDMRVVVDSDVGPDAPPEAPAVFTVAVISDLNGSYGAATHGAEVHDAVRWLTQVSRPELVISTGDMVAGQRAGLDYDAMWAGFHAAVTDPLAQAGIPLLPTPGNHDASIYPGFEPERERYIAQWSARRPPRVKMVDGANYPLYYAFEHGPALFVSLDDTQIGALPAPQQRWLEGVLMAHADKPIKIIYGHVPQAPFTQGREAEIMGDPGFDALLERHGVTAFISGHHHAYYPGKRGNVRHISMACLGTGPRRLIGGDVVSPRAVALLQYDATGWLSVEAYTGPGMSEQIPRAILPGMIAHGPWTTFRDDL